jgi:hypothetical protein
VHQQRIELTTRVRILLGFQGDADWRVVVPDGRQLIQQQFIQGQRAMELVTKFRRPWISDDDAPHQ